MPTSTTSSSELSSADTSSPSTPPPSPMKSQRRPTPLRIDSVGVDPSIIVGKLLTKITRSSTHPCMRLRFSDNSTYQILVDGYDPAHPGLPKELEMDPTLASLLDATDGQLDVAFTIDDCALVTLTDKAFDANQRAQRWEQNHTGVAFKFREDRSWHCVWATLADHEDGQCVFRSYDDVYLDQLQRSPRKRRPRAVSASPVKSR